jgi:integrase
MLSPQLLELLRDWWRIERPRGWLFPGQNPVNHLTTRQLNRVVHATAHAAEITKRVTPHTLRHYVSFRTMSGTLGFGPVFPANFSGHRRHSFDFFYPACTGQRAMNGAPSTNK